MQASRDSRYQRFLRRLQARDLDGFIITHPPNLFYLFGFSGSSGLAFCMDGNTLLLVDSRYIEQAHSQAINCSPLLVRTSLEESLRTMLHSVPGKRIGIESKHLSHYQLLQIQPHPRSRSDPEVVATTGLIEELRIIKEQTEIESLRQAFVISHRAYQRARRRIRVGLTELEVAARLEFELRHAGGEGISFETIVASGPRSSLPHGSASRKVLQKGESIVIDFGVKYQGYNSDLTRVYFLPGARRPAIYNLVREAQQKALQTIRPGIRCCDVDRAARRFLSSKGYGAHFGHSTGHGLGLEVHELPMISSRSRRKLRKGMVFTVEPGVYLPGRHGVRIEDVVVVTQDGFRLLSDPDR